MGDRSRDLGSVERRNSASEIYTCRVEGGGVDFFLGAPGDLYVTADAFL